MKKQGWFTVWVLVGLALGDFAEPRSLLAGGFVITDVSTTVLANTTTGFEFAVHASAVWVGNQSTAGFNRIFRTFWWVSGLEWCDNSDPDPLKHCGTIGRVFHAPPFTPGFTISCTSFNGCAANKRVGKMCCGWQAIFYTGKADVLNLHGGTSVDDEEFAFPTGEVPCRDCSHGGGQCALIPGTETWVMGPGGEPRLADEQLRFGLERVERRPESLIYLEEWAVLSFEGGWPAVQEASTEAFGRRVASAAHAFAPVDGGRSTVLVVETAPHPHNARYIPKPTVVPFDVRIGAGGVESQEFLFRAEVGGMGLVEDVTLFDASRLLAPGVVRTAILTNLRLEYADARRHRSVVHARGIVTRDGRVVVEKGLVNPVNCCDDCCFDPEYGWTCPCGPPL